MWGPFAGKQIWSFGTNPNLTCGEMKESRRCREGDNPVSYCWVVIVRYQRNTPNSRGTKQ